MTETAHIVKTLMSEVKMEVREYGADAGYLTMILGQMFQRAYDAGREDLVTENATKRTAELFTNAADENWLGI